MSGATKLSNWLDDTTTCLYPKLARNVKFTAGTAITAGNYEVGRDADATNQLHFNVPTGSTMEWSINDVAQMLLNSSGPILKVGAGADVPASTTASQVVVYATNDGASAMILRDSTTNIESFWKTTVAGPVMFGTFTDHSLQVWTGNGNRLTFTSSGYATFTPAAQASGNNTVFTLTGPAHASITAASENIDVNYNLSATKTWAAGAGPLATQRDYLLQARTYNGNVAGALTITDAYTLYVSGPPIQGTNLTITNGWAAGFGGNVSVSGSVYATAVGGYRFLTGAYYFAAGTLYSSYVTVDTAVIANSTLSLNLRGSDADDANAIAVRIGNSPALTTAGGKICSFYSDNMVTERASISIKGSMTLGINAAYGGGITISDLFTVQTADATVTDIATVAVAEGDLWVVTATVIGRQSDGSNRALYTLQGCFYRNVAGNVTQTGSTIVITSIESNAAWDCTLNADTVAQTVDVRVTGVAATTIDWKCKLEYMRVT
jgi:hypothetical protein